MKGRRPFKPGRMLQFDRNGCEIGAQHPHGKGNMEAAIENGKRDQRIQSPHGHHQPEKADYQHHGRKHLRDQQKRLKRCLALEVHTHHRISGRHGDDNCQHGCQNADDKRVDERRSKLDGLPHVDKIFPREPARYPTRIAGQHFIAGCQRRRDHHREREQVDQDQRREDDPEDHRAEPVIHWLHSSKRDADRWPRTPEGRQTSTARPPRPHRAFRI